MTRAPDGCTLVFTVLGTSTHHENFGSHSLSNLPRPPFSLSLSASNFPTRSLSQSQTALFVPLLDLVWSSLLWHRSTGSIFLPTISPTDPDAEIRSHLLDAALVNLGRTDLEPGKGYHFTAGPYVEYIGAVSADDKDSLAAAVSAECQRLIDAAILTVVTEEVDPATGAASRVVNVGGCTCPCGGTHVQNTAEIVSITVTRIKKVKKNVKVSMSTTHLYLP